MKETRQFLVQMMILCRPSLSPHSMLIDLVNELTLHPKHLFPLFNNLLTKTNFCFPLFKGK